MYVDGQDDSTLAVVRGVYNTGGSGMEERRTQRYGGTSNNNNIVGQRKRSYE